MAGSNLPDGIDYIAGDGDYAIEVVSGSRHQDRLEWLAQGRDEDPKDYACSAVLTHEPDNPLDSNAVNVSILGVRVGFLPRDAAADFVAAMQTWGFEQASCDAIVEGGWYRSADDKGDFYVRLDVNPDFAPADTLIVDEAPVRGAMLVATAPPKPGFDVRSMGFGATAMFTILALLGVVWLVIQPDQRDAGRRSAVASLVPVAESAVQSGARLASAEEPKAEPAPALRGAAEVKQASTIPTGLTTAAAKARRDPKAAASILGIPAVESVPRLPATGGVPPVAAPPVAVGSVAENQPMRETVAAGADDARLAEAPANVAADRQVPIAAVPSPVVEEVRAAIEGKRVAAVSATPVVKEVPPPVADAFSPAAPPSPPSRPDRPGSAADSTPSQPAVQAAKPEKKVRSSKRRSRFSRRSRASRSHHRSRNTQRYRRRHRAAQARQDTATAPARPSNTRTDSQAARMLRGWTEEWTSASPLLAQPRPAQ